jgi:hypothetical protein
MLWCHLFVSEPVFFGENYWNKLTQDFGSAAWGLSRAARLRFGRSAMMATGPVRFSKKVGHYVQ